MAPSGRYSFCGCNSGAMRWTGNQLKVAEWEVGGSPSFSELKFTIIKQCVYSDFLRSSIVSLGGLYFFP